MKALFWTALLAGILTLPLMAEGERIKLGDFYMKANEYAKRTEGSYFITHASIVGEIDVTEGLRFDGKLLQSHFPVGSTLLQLRALGKPDQGMYVFYILFTKEQYKAYQKKYLRQIWSEENVWFTGVDYKNFFVKTLIPGMNNNFWVFVPTDNFKRFRADQFGEVDEKLLAPEPPKTVTEEPQS